MWVGDRYGDAAPRTTESESVDAKREREEEDRLCSQYTEYARARAGAFRVAIYSERFPDRRA